jgi:hypothetical protein
MSRLGSPPAASRRVAIAKPKNDIYVALLAIATFALLVGTLMLFLEWNEYEYSTTPKVSQAVPQSMSGFNLHAPAGAHGFSQIGV